MCALLGPTFHTSEVRLSFAVGTIRDGIAGVASVPVRVHHDGTECWLSMYEIYQSIGYEVVQEEASVSTQNNRRSNPCNQPH